MITYKFDDKKKKQDSGYENDRRDGEGTRGESSGDKQKKEDVRDRRQGKEEVRKKINS